MSSGIVKTHLQVVRKDLVCRKCHVTMDAVPGGYRCAKCGIVSETDEKYPKVEYEAQFGDGYTVTDPDLRRLVVAGRMGLYTLLRICGRLPRY